MIDSGTTGEFVTPALMPILLIFAATVRAWTFFAGLPFLRATIRLVPLFTLSLALGFFVVLENGGRYQGSFGWPIVAALFAEAAAGFLLSVPFSFAACQVAAVFRLVDLLRGAQEAEQSVPGLPDRSSVLERGAWLGVCTLIFSGGGHQVLIDFWLRSEHRLPPLFLTSICFKNRPIWSSVLVPYLVQCSQIALEAVSGAILFSAPLISAAIAIDLIRMIAGRIIGDSGFCTELHGIKLVIILLLGAALIAGHGAEILARRIDYAVRTGTAAINSIYSGNPPAHGLANVPLGRDGCWSGQDG